MTDQPDGVAFVPRDDDPKISSSSYSEQSQPRLGAMVEPAGYVPQATTSHQKPYSSRLEDVFQEEIILRFPKMSEFKKFARSGKGLRLSAGDVESICEDYRHSEDQKYQMLALWQQRMGKEATSRRIMELTDAYCKSL